MSKPREFWIDPDFTAIYESKEDAHRNCCKYVQIIEKSAYTALEEQNEKLKDELKGYKMGADIEAREGDIARAQARKLAGALELIRKHGCDDSHAWLNAEQALKDFRGEK